MFRKIIIFFLTLLFVILLIDPTDRIFHLKIPLFLMLIFIWILSKKNTNIKYKPDSIYMVIVLLTISLFGIVIAFLQNSIVDYGFSMGFIKSLIFLFLLVIIIDLDIEPDVILTKYSIVLPLITIPLYCIILYFPVIMVFVYNYLVLNKEVAMISNRNFYGYALVMVYYKTSAVLVFPLSFYCNKLLHRKNFYSSLLFVLLFFASLIMSGTRANIVSALLIVVYYLYLYIKLKRNVIYSIISIMAFVFITIIFALSLSFEKADDSSEIKSGHFVSFVKNIEENPEYLIWGQGLGSEFYTSGKNAFATQTELTYFDLVRFFGLPLTILFLLMITYPIIYLYKNKMINERNKYAIVAFIMYLFISGTNPLLVSSTGMVILIIMYSFTNKRIYNLT